MLFHPWCLHTMGLRGSELNRLVPGALPDLRAAARKLPGANGFFPQWSPESWRHWSNRTFCIYLYMYTYLRQNIQPFYGAVNQSIHRIIVLFSVESFIYLFKDSLIDLSIHSLHNCISFLFNLCIIIYILLLSYTII